ncbi:hypothetical protein FHETE_6144 [Fusarium heterosporum]|uniref:BZIP domain-containing protein n=1 Tax=Fusarium heterosporum TaxID=42747 RepID=A0A8H5TCD5_FUSHE|nr:hypothetical protein FHETE_6144 [Fusarium heterosporum]
MDPAYAGLQHPAQHPLAGEIQPFQAYSPVTDAKFLPQDALGMRLGGELPQANWGQWWSPPDTAFAEVGSMTVPNVFPQDFQSGNYNFDQNSTAQWESPASSAYTYPQPSPSVDSPSTAISTVDLEGRRGSSATSSDKQKRKRNAPPPPATKTSRRTSTRKTTKPEAAPDKPKRRAGKAKIAAQSPKKSASDEEEEPADHSERVQERNRVASNKFRVKKREDAKRLRIDEKEVEQTNQNLSVTVSDLTLQVYELKMKLLQHTDCNCHLIQNFIANEAHRYIQDLGTENEKQLTPAIPPEHSYGS